MKILVGSQNPVKIDAAREAFSRFFDNVEIVGINVPSGVPDQPVEEQVLEGAKNRAGALRRLNNEKNLGAGYFVGIEGGIAMLAGKWFSFGGMCVMDAKGNTGFGTSPLFELPEFIISELLKGVELGDVMDKLQNETNTKQKHGAIGFFTNGVMNRKELYVPGIITAMIPLVKSELFNGKREDFII